MDSSTEIINGPSKFDLMQALFACKPTPIKVTFHFPLTESSVTILSVEREDGSGESWNLRGVAGNNQKWKAYYRTDKRIGTITLLN